MSASQLLRLIFHHFNGTFFYYSFTFRNLNIECMSDVQLSINILMFKFIFFPYLLSNIFTFFVFLRILRNLVQSLTLPMYSPVLLDYI